MWRSPAKLILFIFLLFVIVEGLAPVVVTQGAKWALSGVSEGPVNINLSASPRSKMLVGRFDRVQLDFMGFQTRRIVLKRLTLDIRALHLDLRSLFLDQQLRVASPMSMRLRAEVSEAALADYWSGERSALEEAQLELQEDQLSVSGLLAVLGQRLNVRIDGDPLIVSNSEAASFQLVPTNVYVEGKELPEPLRSAALALLETQPLEAPLDFGIDVNWTDIRIEHGSLVLEGTLERGAQDSILPDY